MTRVYKITSTRYKQVHRRLRRARGKASNYLCDECGKPATEWAYNHTDPNPLVQVLINWGRAQPMEYSLDQDRYVPMCHSCHVHQDRSRELGIGSFQYKSTSHGRR